VAVNVVAVVAAPFLAACSDPGGAVGPAPGAVRLSTMAAAGRAGEVIPDEYIVTLADSVRDVRRVARGLVAQAGGELRFEYVAALKGFAARLPAAAVEGIGRNPRVARIEQDATVPLADVQTGADWGIDRIDQRSLPLDGRYAYASSGAGATVYIIDSGIRMSHAEFGGRAVPGYSSINDGRGGNDCAGHGTHVAGIVGSGRYGVAKAARLVSVRVYDCNGSTTTSGLLGGVDWVTKNVQRPAVANMSLGGTYSATLNQAVQNSIAAGITYVVSAGNYSTDACTISPASVGAAITVGASTWSDEQASFSDYGACVDLYAPGVSILSTYFTSDTASYWLSGTSMAAPFAAGAAAVYLSANPQASPAAVAEALTSSATVGLLGRLGSGSPNLLLFSGTSGERVAPITSSPAPPPQPAIDAPPAASVTVSCAKRRCSVDATASSDDHGIVSYSWDFGDGSPVVSGTAAKVVKLYEAVGTFTISVTVSDGSGQSARAQRAVTIKRL
jgi:subtilisin family serine protease